ncbi:MAG TPA: TIGR04255 family protein [Candidatus Binataceae bacterium]|nr:TIGR04255 family protein [Candidatus Binataceae bacterium]
MSDITFHNAPLIEILAELRWHPAQLSMPFALSGGAAQQPMSIVVGNPLEVFFGRFSDEISKHGFRRSERLVPPGQAFVQGQAAVRFRSDPEKLNVLYQIGHGMFSANATPPYRSWSHFLPEVEKGIDALLASRADDEKATSFSSVSLRYIDAFNPNLTKGYDVTTFLSDVLKFRIDLPDVLVKYRVGNVRPFLALTIPTAKGSLYLAYAEGLVAGKTGIVFDTTFSVVQPIPPQREAIVIALDSAHTVIRDVFMELTKPIHPQMQPEH